MNKRYQTIRRVTITGAMADLEAAQDYLRRNGYRYVSLSPAVLGVGRIDNTHFKLVGEREVEP